MGNLFSVPKIIRGVPVYYGAPCPYCSTPISLGNAKYVKFEGWPTCYKCKKVFTHYDTPIIKDYPQ